MRSRRLVAVLALSLATLGLATPSEAADTGTLTVTVVDEHGDPMPGQLGVLAPAGGGTPGGIAISTLTSDLPPGEYAVVSMTPWGGMQCAGMTDCTYTALLGGAVDTDGAVTVRAGETTQVRIEGRTPLRVAGPARVGKRLSVTWSPGMQTLVELFGMSGAGLAPQVQWLRDGTPIAGATGPTYRAVGADAGRTLSARATYSDLARAQLEMMSGQPVTPRTSNRLEVGKVKTEAFATLGDSTIPAGRQGRVRVDVTAPGQIVTGRVRLTIGDWTRTASLRNGSARFVLPALTAGRYTVRAAYLGSSVYEAAQAKAKTLTVTR